jgi:hypothetical protein
MLRSGSSPSSKGLEVVADQLIETLSQRTGRPPGSSNCLFVDRTGDVHGHRIRAQGCCVTRAPLETRVHGRLELPAWDRPGLFELGRSVAPLVPKKLFQVQDRSNWEWGRSEMAQRNLYSPDRRL